MLGLLSGINRGLERESDARDRHVSAVVGVKQWKANYDLQKTDLESLLEARSIQNEAARQAMRFRAEEQPYRIRGLRLGNEQTQQSIDFNKEANPLRLQGMRDQNEMNRQTLDFNKDANPLRLQGMRDQNEMDRQKLDFNKDANPLRLQGMRDQNEMNRQTLDFNREANPKRLEWMDLQNKRNQQLYEQSEETFNAESPYRSYNAWLDSQQKKANLALTEKQTAVLGLKSSSGSSKGPLTWPQGKEVVEDIVGYMAKEYAGLGKRWYWWDKIPWESADPNTTGQTQMLDQLGRSAFTELYRRFGGDMSMVQLHLDTLFDRMLSDKKHGGDIRNTIISQHPGVPGSELPGVSGDRAKLRDARRLFLQGAMRAQDQLFGGSSQPSAVGNQSLGEIDIEVGTDTGRETAPKSEAPNTTMQLPNSREPLGDFGVKWNSQYSQSANVIANQAFGANFEHLNPEQKRAVALVAHDLTLDEMSAERDAFLNSLSNNERMFMKEIMKVLMGEVEFNR